MIPGYVPAIPQSGRSLKTIIVDVGLTTNLKLCLDAGDINSYPGSGGKWLDTSGGGYDFFLGTSTATQSTDPTFNGVPGRLSENEYFSFDGGDYFTYDSSNEPWMLNIGKANNYVSMFCVVRYEIETPSASQPIFATDGPLSSQYGIYCAIGTNSKISSTWVNSSGSSPIGIGAAGATLTAPGLYFLGLSEYTVASAPYYIMVNGTTYQGTTPATNFTTQNAVNTMKIGARGDAGLFLPNGSRLYALAIWDGIQFTSTQFSAIYDGIKTRYGL